MLLENEIDCYYSVDNVVMLVDLDLDLDLNLGLVGCKRVNGLNF